MILSKIKELCKKRNISIGRLEADVGMGKGVIYSWGKKTPTIDNLIRVADYFDVSLDIFRDKTDGIS